MSIEDNTNETENQQQAAESNQPPTTESQSSPNEAMESAKGVANGVIGSLLELKQSNPKVFFGGAGAIAVIFLFLVMSGGSDPKLPVHQAKPIVPGQNYVLKSPNTYDPTATVRLVAVPGSMAAYDDTEEADREGSCKHMPQNTAVKLTQSQADSTDSNVVWVEVEMTGAGDCQGKRGWTSAINLQ